MSKKGQVILSGVLPTGEILETVYNPNDRETFLAIYKNDQCSIEVDYTDSKGNEWLPYPPNDLVTKGFVKLPSNVGKYETIQKLFEQIKDFVAEFVKLPEDFLTVTSVYILMTWLYDRFETLPYLRILGDFGTGKSRFHQVVGNLCYKPVLGSAMSTASIFRTIDQLRGTLVLDEADFRSSEYWSEITKILNVGHTKGFPVVRMNVNKKDGSMEIQTFEVYGPKILCSRERFGDEALESRCLTEHLLPIKTGRQIHLPGDFNERATSIRNNLLAFRFDKFYKVTTDEVTLGNLQFPRLQQTSLAITSLASLIDKAVLQSVLAFLYRYEKELMTSRKHDVKADVLLCILDLIEKRKTLSMPKIYMLDIAMQFNERFYEEYSDTADRVRETREGVFKDRQRIISPKKIGNYVRKLGIKTERDQDGFYIQSLQEAEKIGILKERYGFEKPEEVMKTDKDIEDIPF